MLDVSKVPSMMAIAASFTGGGIQKPVMPKSDWKHDDKRVAKAQAKRERRMKRNLKNKGGR